ncbi:unnamed protein product, partial [Linum tenue]
IRSTSALQETNSTINAAITILLSTMIRPIGSARENNRSC